MKQPLCYAYNMAEGHYVIKIPTPIRKIWVWEFLLILF